jgi:hypothetical protein
VINYCLGQNMSETDTIQLPLIALTWSEWTTWDDLKSDTGNRGAKIPSVPGIYEVKYADTHERLTIGRTSNLRQRIRGGLVNGTSPHSTGEKIRKYENTSQLVIRWAKTDRPAASEEEYHMRYKAQFGQLPKYTAIT